VPTKYAAQRCELSKRRLKGTRYLFASTILITLLRPWWTVTLYWYAVTAVFLKRVGVLRAAARTQGVKLHWEPYWSSDVLRPAKWRWMEAVRGARALGGSAFPSVSNSGFPRLSAGLPVDDRASSYHQQTNCSLVFSRDRFHPPRLIAFMKKRWHHFGAIRTCTGAIDKRYICCDGSAIAPLSMFPGLSASHVIPCVI